MAIGLVTSMLLLTKTVTLADIVDSGGGRHGGGLHHKRERGQAGRALVQVLY